MGYGGNLIWTTVFKALNTHSGRKIAPVHMPKLSDLLAGRNYDASVSLAEDAIYRGNPRLIFPKTIPKTILARISDRLFEGVLSVLGLREAFERYVLAHTEQGAAGPMVVHVDMRRHSYALRQERFRTVWKPHARAADAMLSTLGGGSSGLDCEMFFTADEHAAAQVLLDQHGIAERFLAIEPATNPDFFGTLRAWPHARWVEAIARLRLRFPGMPIVQLGVGADPAIPGAIDFRGATSFRTAALVLARATLFIGTEGGLMHAANAVGARALILWGGVTLPDFIGYPTRQTTLCKYVACAPCGRHGHCEVGNFCMTDIGVDETVAAAEKLLEQR